MQLTITINLDNAAFKDDPSELGRILHECALSQSNIDRLPSPGRTKLRAINGDTVGRAIITE